MEKITTKAAKNKNRVQFSEDVETIFTYSNEVSKPWEDFENQCLHYYLIFKH